MGRLIHRKEEEYIVLPWFHIFCRNSVVRNSVKPSFNPFLHCVVWCYVVILMIISACISSRGISVRPGWFRSPALSTALSLNQLFLQTNFTAVILIKWSAHCDFLFNQSSQFHDVRVRTIEYKTTYPLGKKNNLLISVFIRVNISDK